jgi:hypothetical protein
MHFVRKDYVRLNAGEAFTEALKLMLTGIELEQPKAAGGGAKKNARSFRLAIQRMSASGQDLKRQQPANNCRS